MMMEDRKVPEVLKKQQQKRDVVMASAKTVEQASKDAGGNAENAPPPRNKSLAGMQTRSAVKRRHNSVGRTAITAAESDNVNEIRHSGSPGDTTVAAHTATGSDIQESIETEEGRHPPPVLAKKQPVGPPDTQFRLIGFPASQALLGVLRDYYNNSVVVGGESNRSFVWPPQLLGESPPKYSGQQQHPPERVDTLLPEVHVPGAAAGAVGGRMMGGPGMIGNSSTTTTAAIVVPSFAFSGGAVAQVPTQQEGVLNLKKDVVAKIKEEGQRDGWWQWYCAMSNIWTDVSTKPFDQERCNTFAYLKPAIYGLGLELVDAVKSLPADAKGQQVWRRLEPFARGDFFLATAVCAAAITKDNVEHTRARRLSSIIINMMSQARKYLKVIDQTRSCERCKP